MNNNVVIAIQRHFLSLGYITACINFRGCGKSKGKTSWTGMSERDDYITVMDYLLSSNEKYPKINQFVICVCLFLFIHKKEVITNISIVGLFFWCYDC
jgi:alpha/beta superfamily hydrolase